MKIVQVWRGGASVVAILYAGMAMAQAPAEPGQSAPPSAQRNEGGEDISLGDIVVTAQKRSERLQDVPVAVAAVTPETLTKAGIESTAALMSVVPGLNVNDSPFGFRPFLRGVGTSSSAAGNENSVSTYVDNIYMTSMNGGLLNLSSIESIEVLKGPQGTLFGRNATGGVIHVKTRDPSHDLGGSFSLSFDNYETVIAKAYLTGGLSDNLAADIAVYYRDQGDGYGTNLATGSDVGKDKSFTVRSKLLFTPTDNDTLTLAVDYSQTKSTGQVYHPFKGTTVNWGPPDATHPLPKGAPYVFTGGAWDVDMATDPYFRSKAGGGSLTYVHEFPWASLSSFTAYRKSKMRTGWNSTPIPTNATFAGYIQPEHQFSQELQLSSLPGSKVQWILGAYYLDAEVKYDPFFLTGLTVILSPSRPDVLVQQQFRMKQTIKSPALYGQFTVPVEALGDTNITGGLRYTIDKRAIVGHIEILPQPSTLGPVENPTTILGIGNATDASKTFKTFTWRLSLDHHFTPDIMAYVSYNRGFKAGSYNSIPPGGPKAAPTNPEYLDAYEVGMKNVLFGGKATLNLSAFYYQYTDMQVTIFNAASAITVNAAAAEIKGLSAELNARITRNFRLALGGEFLDHKFKDYKNGPILTPLTLAQGGGVMRTFGDLSGKRLPWASDTVVNAGAFYDLPTDIGDFDANVNYTWNSGYSFEPSDVIRSGSFGDLNISAGWKSLDGKTRIAAFGKNLTNEKAARAVSTGGNPGGYLEVQYRPPRTYGVTLSQEF